MKKNNVHIILTNDYEICGNGGGDVDKCIIEPTKKMLAIASKHGVPVTLMLDIAEYNAFTNEYQKGNLSDNIALKIRSQLIEAIRSIHDVQLHLHPQWLNYKYDKDNNEWELDLSLWRTSSLEKQMLKQILIESKTQLETLFKPINSEYSCMAFRAGAWCIQPEKNVLEALFEAGFMIDTSVSLKQKLVNEYTNYDFSAIKNRPYWYCKKDFNEDLKTGILELPVQSIKILFFERVFRYFFNKFSSGLSSGCICKPFQKKNKSQLTDYFKSAYLKLDYCKYSYKDLMRIIRKIEKKHNNYEILPLVAVGHSKEFKHPDDFENFIIHAKKYGYKFSTFNDIVNKNEKRSSTLA